MCMLLLLCKVRYRADQKKEAVVTERHGTQALKWAHGVHTVQVCHLSSSVLVKYVEVRTVGFERCDSKTFMSSAQGSGDRRSVPIIG